MELIKEKLAKATCSKYALESMIYLTTGIIDEYETPDVDVETSIIGVYAHEELLKLASLALNFMGPKSMIAGEPTETFLKDALQLYTHGEPIDSLSLFVGLAGVQHAGVSFCSFFSVL